MTHIALAEADALVGRPLVDRNHERIGTIAGPVGEAENGQVAWLKVQVEGSEQTEATIPVLDAHIGPDEIRVPYRRVQVLEAPAIGENDHDLRQWYGIAAVDDQIVEGRHQYEHPGLEL